MDCSDISHAELREKLARLEERLVSADKALELSRQSLTAWQISSNEWRKENIDQRNLYMTIEKGEGMFKSIELRIDLLERARSLAIGGAKAIDSMWVFVLAMISILISVIALFMRFPK